MKDIVKRLLTKTNTDINKVYFLYGGNSNINSELKFSEIEMIMINQKIQ